jgi:peptidoglycan/xylan/chitin deacetylase (PgdA/CDA1 family)
MVSGIERPTRRLAILAYHKVGEPPGGWDTWSYISGVTFEGHLRYLEQNRWQVLDISKFFDGLEDQEALPERSALITFDDGYRSNLEVAAPLLRRFGYCGVIFVPTGFIGGYNAFDADISYEPREAICGWEELRELESKGISVQSHGVSHRRFSDLDAVEQQRELFSSKAVLEAGLGKRIELFSFPYGDSGLDPRQVAGMLARIGYRAACLYGGGPMYTPITTPFGLMRLAVGPDTDLSSMLQDA